MSQHVFFTEFKGAPARVQMGWDRPLQCFYLVVQLLNEPDERKAYPYSNLDDPGAEDCDLNYFSKKLKALGITVPETMFFETALDRCFNVGNRRMTHAADGTMT